MTDEEHEKLMAEKEAQWKHRLDMERAWGEIGRSAVQALRMRGTSVPMHPKLGSGIEKLVAKYVVMGKDFDTLMGVVKKDVMLASAWDQFAMYLRLAQGDNDGEEE